MNQREALRWAASELAEYAAQLAEDYGDPSVSLPLSEEEEGKGDRERVIAAFTELHERMNLISIGRRKMEA